MKVKLWADVGFVGCRQVEIVELPDDISDKELEEEAQEFFQTSMSPDWGFERLPDDYDEDEDEDL